MLCFSLWFWLWCAFHNRPFKKHIILLSKCTSRLADKRIHINLVSSVSEIKQFMNGGTLGPVCCLCFSIPSMDDQWWWWVLMLSFPISFRQKKTKQNKTKQTNKKQKQTNKKQTNKKKNRDRFRGHLNMMYKCHHHWNRLIHTHTHQHGCTRRLKGCGNIIGLFLFELSNSRFGPLCDNDIAGHYLCHECVPPPLCCKRSVICNLVRECTLW